LEENILRIESSAKPRRLFYQHGRMIVPKYSIMKYVGMRRYSEALYIDGELYANTEKRGSAAKLAERLGLNLESVGA